MKEQKITSKINSLANIRVSLTLPSHCDKNCFMLPAMDHMNNANKNSLSGRMHAHDTAITLFQVQPEKHI